MLETADRIESSTQETAPDSAAGRSPHVDAPPNGTADFRWLGRVLVGCLVGEVAVVAIALAVLAGGRTSSTPEVDPDLDRTAESASDSGFAAAGDATESFLLAWGRSLELDHATTGTLTRTVLDGNTLFSSTWPIPTADTEDPTTTMWLYRHSRLDGRTLTQVGDVATVVDPVDGRRSCFRQTAGFACSAGTASPGDLLPAIQPAVRGETATHRIVETDPVEVLADFPRLPPDIQCWEARSLTDGIDQRWGRRAQFCFHDPSGAAVFRRVLGTTRVEVLVVESVSETVSPTDLDPA